MRHSKIDKAIAQLEDEIKVLQLAILKLRAQQPPAKPSKPQKAIALLKTKPEQSA